MGISCVFDGTICEEGRKIILSDEGCCGNAAEAAALGLGTCILGWFDDKTVREICSLDEAVRLVITLGYPKADAKIPEKKRKPIEELVGEVE